MRKAFTLIELLVVIAIIAILAAILFPVFAQAKQAAKKTQGLAQAKQVGTAQHIYLADYDDVLYLYRTTEQNPDYAKCVAAGGVGYPAACTTLWGTSTRTRTFWNQILRPYVKNDAIFRSPGNPKAWVNYDPSGAGQEPAFRSYGGQNSLASNTIIFESDGGVSMSHTAIDNVANTLVLVDASYYNALPRFDGNLRLFAGRPTWTTACTSTDRPQYWKNLGNSYLFNWNGSATVYPTDAEAEKAIEQRYSGALVVIHADSHAKASNYKSVMWDLRDNPTNSMWDPWKAGVQACP
ncbi:MAG: prepilin-type N-terminal cleavage/methylation domain-containing protein [Fimbriimonadaceae bacterium]|nr:prepilin-type N-terminal cleavage/methylation domain-containing protein [Fimbriimonadaceae bacterium]